MVRMLIIIMTATFFLGVVCLAGAFAIGGSDITRTPWIIPLNRIVDGEDGPVGVGTHERSLRELAWAGESLTIDLPANVTYVQGPESKVVIEGPKILVDRITVENGVIRTTGSLDSAGEVRIDFNGVRMLDNGVRITVTAPKVTAFTLNGSGDLDIQGYDQPAITVQVQGSGDVEGAGTTQSARLGIIGSGSIDLSDLAAQDAQVSTSGSGDAVVAAKGVVSVSIAGSGGVSLREKPASLATEISGSGDVDQDY
jgi:hypothetical protein